VAIQFLDRVVQAGESGEAEARPLVRDSSEQALVLLSLGHAIRSAAFLIPSGLGAQEAGFMVLGAMYGLPPGVGLAVSLAIRLREVVLGVPALVVWPFLEGRRVLANR